MSSHVLMLVGHGTRDEEGQHECARLRDAVRDEVRAHQRDLRVELGYLELCPPPIGDSVAGFVADGVDRVTVVPLVLLGAGHAKGDVPAAITRERRRHPHVRFDYAEPLGIRPELLDIVDERLAAAVPAAERDETAVVLVGRGSTDPDANADLAKVSRLLWEGRPWPLVEPAFVSLAEPSVSAALTRCRQLGARRLVVVPYFLFTGVLERRIREQAAEWAAEHPEVTIAQAGYLGPDSRIAGAVLARAEQAGAGRATANCDTCVYRVALPGFEDRVGQPQTLHHHPHDPGTGQPHGHAHPHDHHPHGHAHPRDHHDRRAA